MPRRRLCPPARGRRRPTEDLATWSAFEDAHADGRARAIGVCNVAPTLLTQLIDGAATRVAPMIVQSRCYASSGWDYEIRALCRAHGIVYQVVCLHARGTAMVDNPMLAHEKVMV